MTNTRKLRNPGNLRTQVRTCEVDAINDTVGQVRTSQDRIAGVRLMHAVWPWVVREVSLWAYVAER